MLVAHEFFNGSPIILILEVLVIQVFPIFQTRFVLIYIIDYIDNRYKLARTFGSHK